MCTVSCYHCNLLSTMTQSGKISDFNKFLSQNNARHAFDLLTSPVGNAENLKFYRTAAFEYYDVACKIWLAS